MKYVYILTRHFHYQNEDIIAVYSSEKKAVEACEKLAMNGYYNLKRYYVEGGNMIACWDGRNESINLYKEEVK